MNVIEIETGRIGYHDLLDLVRGYGEIERSSPRGLPTRDAGPTCVVLLTPSDSLPTGVGRAVSPRVAAAEAVQLVGGFSDPRLLPGPFDRFKEDDGSLHGAYGPRVRDQLRHVVRKLVGDPDTRQAVVTIWDPARDNDPHPDIPCTVTIAFRLVRDRLRMRVVMRSQDVWLGTPYDWFQFAQLQLTLARVLGVGVGVYHHVTLSTHIYEPDLELVDEVTVGEYHAPEVDTPEGFGRPGDDLTAVMSRALDLPYVNRLVTGMTVDELWYRRHLADRLELRNSS